MEQLLDDINLLIKGIWDYTDNPEKLSLALMKLEVKLEQLSGFVIQARYDADRAETLYKSDMIQKKLEYIKTVDPDSDKNARYGAGVAENMAQLDLKDQLLEVLGEQKLHAMLKLKREDTQRIVDAARSRLSLIKQDVRLG